MAEVIRGGNGAEAPKAGVPAGAGKLPEVPPAGTDLTKFKVRELTKGEPVTTPYGTVLVGVNSVVVTCNGRNIPMPVPVAEALFGYKQGG